MRNLSLVIFGLILVSICKGEYKSAKLEVKAFINDHANFYNNFEVKYIGGADPELVFVKSDDTEERIAVDEMETEQICKTIEGKGFERKEKLEAPPEHEL